MNTARQLTLRFLMQQHTLLAATISGVPKYACDELLCNRFATSSKELIGGIMNDSIPMILRAPKMNEEQKQKRLKFLEAEKDWDALVQWTLLSEDEKEIVNIHKQAVMNGHFTYEDPKTKYKVMTRLKHYLRGSCCGNACRHCVYGHEKVPEEKKGAKIFNSAYWVEK